VTRALIARSPEEVAEHIECLLNTPGWQIADYHVHHEPFNRRAYAVISNVTDTRRWRRIARLLRR